MATGDGRSPATLVCRGCSIRFPDPRRLAVHLERHREVRPAVYDPATGAEISHPCPAGCGRSFPTLMGFREHAPVCDGQAPLPPLGGRHDVPIDGEHRYKVYQCPECRIRIDDPVKLGAHIERHREVDPPVRGGRFGKLLSTACPKGCGRHFLKEHEMRKHAGVCDGSTPIARGTVPAARHEGGEMYHCSDCGRDFGRPNTLAIHRKHKHPVDGAPRKEEPRADPEDGREAADGAAVFAKLREKAAAHRKTADRLEAIVKELELLL